MICKICVLVEVYEMANIIKKEERKDNTITIRCTKKEKEAMEQQARKKDMTISQYMLDCGIAGKERHRIKDRRMLKKVVEHDEKLNRLNHVMGKTPEEKIPEELKVIIKELIEEGSEQWLF